MKMEETQPGASPSKMLASLWLRVLTAHRRLVDSREIHTRVEQLRLQDSKRAREVKRALNSFAMPYALAALNHTRTSDAEPYLALLARSVVSPDEPGTTTNAIAVPLEDPLRTQLDALHEIQLIEKQTSPNDGRLVLYVSTPELRDLIDTYACPSLLQALKPRR